ncbi:hypothetical protein PInf_017934 [Phytophthora infestans]|nr:hypothetical protein PInf_017934 [Phytophthora infestans]
MGNEVPRHVSRSKSGLNLVQADVAWSQGLGPLWLGRWTPTLSGVCAGLPRQLIPTPKVVAPAIVSRSEAVLASPDVSNSLGVKSRRLKLLTRRLNGFGQHGRPGGAQVQHRESERTDEETPEQEAKMVVLGGLTMTEEADHRLRSEK